MSDNARINALAAFLEVDSEEISVSRYDETVFEHGREEYRVLTDDEAQSACVEYIRESAWAFRADFVAPYTCLAGVNGAEAVLESIQSMCENGNDAMLALIGDNFDRFADDVIAADRRGHFLAGYDGYEEESGGFYIYRTN